MYQAKAPGKLILSGEHAVVYGNSALAVAINRFVHTKITPRKDSKILIINSRLSQELAVDLSELQQLQEKLEQNYQAFLNKERHIEDVLDHSNELSLYALSRVLKLAKPPINSGATILTEATLPIGCGLGSSAALILSMLAATSKWLNVQLAPELIPALATEIENLQHGHSSSLDINVSLNGGAIMMQDGKKMPSPIGDLSFFVANTGEPESTTGECVSHARQFLEANKPLLQKFQNTTVAMEYALKTSDAQRFMQAIKDNHTLLCQLGIVPKQVQDIVSQLESLGGAAKICGAGSIRGSSAGYLLMQGDKQILTNLCKTHGLLLETLEMMPRFERCAA